MFGNASINDYRETLVRISINYFNNYNTKIVIIKQVIIYSYDNYYYLARKFKPWQCHVLISVLIWNLFLWFCFVSICPLVSVSNEKIYQTSETVFHHISKHLEIIENTLFPLGNVVINSVPEIHVYYTKVCIQFRDHCKSFFWQRTVVMRIYHVSR